MEWRSWLFGRLNGSSHLLALPVADRPTILAGGSLEVTPQRKPFLIITIGQELVDRRDADQPSVTSSFATLWVHDDPGDYLRIDSILLACQKELIGQVSDTSGIFCQWQGNSGDQADDVRGTIVRNAEYRLIGGK